MTTFDSIHQVWPDVSKEKQEKFQFYHDLDLKSRGAFLIQSNWIETDIDSVLALILCGNNKKNIELLKSTLLKRIGFDAKIKSLTKIIKLRYPKISETSPSLKTHIENLANNLETVRKFRNKLAHSSLSLTDDFIEKDPKDRIPIKSFDDGEEKHSEIMKKDVEDKLAIAAYILAVLKHIINHIIGEFSNDSKNKEKSL